MAEGAESADGAGEEEGAHVSRYGGRVGREDAGDLSFMHGDACRTKAAGLTSGGVSDWA